MSKIKLTNKDIQLKHLVKSERNVRSIPHTSEIIEGFARSIQVAGLINPLTVQKGEGSYYEVVCGGGRLDAYNFLLENGEIKDTEKVRCSVAPVDANIEELSLMENHFRKSMTAAEEFEAFNAMQEAGLTEDEIASDFATTKNRVKQRLKLAKVAPEIFEAFKAGKINLDVIQAFAVTDDKDRQVEYFTGNGHMYPQAVRQAMTQESFKSSHYLVKFITLEAYEAEGGNIERDLFSNDDDVYLQDVALVNKLVREKLEKLKQEYLDDGWSWVEFTLEYDHTVLNSASTTLKPQHVDLSEEDQALRSKLQERLEEMDNLSFQECADDHDEEYEQIERNLAELETKEEVFTAEDKAQSGVYLCLCRNDGLEIRRGLVKNKAVENSEDSSEGEAENYIVSNADAAEGSPSTSEQDGPGYTGELLDSLTATRVKAYQAALSQEHELANNVLLHNLANAVFSVGRESVLAINLTQRGTKLTPEERDATSAQKILDDVHAEFSEKISGDPQEMFQKICDLSAEDKQRLQSYCVSVAFKDQLANSRPNTSNKYFYYCNFTKYIEDLMDINIREYWNPGIEDFFMRAKTKKDLLRIGVEIIDEQWAYSRTTEKKPVLAKAVAHLFDPDNEQLTASQRAKAAAWLPDVMGKMKLVEENDEVPVFLEDEIPKAAQ